MPTPIIICRHQLSYANINYHIPTPFIICRHHLSYANTNKQYQWSQFINNAVICVFGWICYCLQIVVLNHICAIW